MRVWRTATGRIGRLAAIKILVTIAAAASSLIVARALTASGQGTYETAMVTALLLVPVAQLSGRIGLIADLASSGQNRTSALGQLALLQVCSAVGSVGLGALLLRSGPPLSGPGLAWAGLAILPAASASSFTHAVWWSERRSLAPELLLLFETIVRLSGVAVIALMDLATPSSMFAVVVASRGVSAIAGLALVHATLAQLTLRHPVGALTRLARGCGLATVTALALKALFRVDILMLGGFGVGVGDIGRYGVGVRLLELAWVAPLAASQTRFLDGASARRSPGGGSTGVDRRLVRLVTGLAAACAAGAVLCSFLLAEGVLGPSYRGMWSMMLLAAPGVVSFSAVPLLRNELFLALRFTKVLGAVVVALVTNVLSNAMLVPLWGAHGAATGTSIAYTALLLILWHDVSGPSPQSRDVPARDRAVP